LNRYGTRALESAAGVCVSRGHYEVKVEHLLSELLQDPAADVQMILYHFGVDHGRLQKALTRQLEGEKTGNTGRPVFSPLLLTWFQDSLLLSSAEYGWTAIRSGALFSMIVISAHSYTSGAWVELLSDISKEELRKQLPSIAGQSLEADSEPGAAMSAAATGGEAGAAGPHGRGPETALGKFTLDFTAQAAEGKMDPVIGRELEIRQCVDILARRRKNNPIIVGEAGTGKTALVEGLAQRVVQGDVPAALAGVEILGLDMGLLQAGAGVKGEFENRLKSVMEEVKGSATPIILFIDEAHTMIGAGGPQGGSDAANLLKPALARGELRTIAATTWTEYKKYFEKDPALSRRFQPVKVEEPSEEVGISMMRGIAPLFEKSHGIRIRDEAVVAAVELSNRYISGRQLPDKSVDLLDTCAARVHIARDARPATLQDMEESIRIMGRELGSLTEELAVGYDIDPKRIEQVEEKLKAATEERDALVAHWEQERDTAKRVVELRQLLAGDEEAEDGDDAAAAEEEAPEAEAAEAEAQEAEETEAAPEEAVEESSKALSAEELQAELDQQLKALEELQADEELVPIDVSADLVAAVVSDWTGVPIGKMVEDEAATLLAFEDRIGERIKGQNPALDQLGEVIRGSKMGLGNPNAPIGVFLMVGPSGVGKTETGLSVAELLFGGERFMVTINMSEFQEKHTVSRLIGSPPGYVGYGEGGVLTEAVRQRPYSAVMLDEVEKADPEVMNLFYQVFDKGMLSDGEGRAIDFKNTVLMMTSNLGSDVMSAMCANVDEPPSPAQVMEAVRPMLSQHFKPALLARMTIVPFFPLSGDAMREIVQLKLGQLVKRMAQSHHITLTIVDQVVDQIAQRCTEVETGARNIDHIMNKTLLPMLSGFLLTQMSEGKLPDAIALDVDEKGEYTLSVPPSTED